MFEKEAEEYVDLSGNRNYTERAFKDGAEFGYNKANEWHYPSKGEYPTTEEEVLVYLWDSFYIGTYCLDSSEINRWHFNDFEEQSDQITAWRYIEPPKEEE